jgi:hypothetical protein
VRFFGCVLLLLGFTSSAFATQEYKEIWNPPEARGASHKHSATAHRSAKHTDGVQHIAKARAHRTPVPKLAMKPGNAPDFSDIPRQITPEGNVLRVDSRNTAAEVTR